MATPREQRGNVYGSVLWKCWCMSKYWAVLSSTALVCIVNLTIIVDLICVCWNVTHAEELRPKCYLVAGASTSLLVDLSGPPWHPSHRLDSRMLCGFYLCVLAT